MTAGLLIGSLAACGETDAPATAPLDPATLPARPSVISSDGDVGHLRVDQQALVDPDGQFGMYTEGSLSFAVLRTTDGREQLASPANVQARYDQIVTLIDADVPPGTYQLEAYQRACGGSCESLDPVSDRCTLDVTIEPGAAVRLLYTFTPGRSCTLTTD